MVMGMGNTSYKAESIQPSQTARIEVIGVGGGSAMDTAKGVAILANNKGPSINYKGFPEEINNPLPPATPNSITLIEL